MKRFRAAHDSITMSRPAAHAPLPEARTPCGKTMAIKLIVPFVTQLDIGGKTVKTGFLGLFKKKIRGWDDWTGCWYASACMIGYYFSAGPRRGVPEIFVEGQGHLATGTTAAFALEQKHHDLLAKREDLVAVANC